MNNTNIDWNRYAAARNLARNRLLFSHHAELVDDFSRVFGALPVDQRVLDIGPAGGFFMALLRELGFETIHGLEVSDVFRERAVSKNLQCFKGDIVTGEGVEQLSPPYDVVTMMEVLEHTSRPRAALRNARGLLKQGGLLYLTVPLCDCVFERLRRARHHMSREALVKRIDETHLQAFSRGEVTSLMKQCGFEVLQTRALSFITPWLSGYYPGNRLFLLLRALLPDTFRGLCLSVIAKGTGRAGGYGET